MMDCENAETLARIEDAEIMAEITLLLRGIHEGLTSHIDFIKRLTAIIEEGNMTHNLTPYIEPPDSLEPEPRPGVSEAERMAEWNRRHDARDALVLQRRYGRLQPEPSWPNRVTLDATTGMVLASASATVRNAATKTTADFPCASHFVTSATAVTSALRGSVAVNVRGRRHENEPGAKDTGAARNC